MNIKAVLNEQERKLFASLNTPYKIQEFLNELPYNDEEVSRSPREMLRAGKTHCAEGARFAAAVNWYHGGTPLLVDMLAENDDDHILAVFQQNNAWGAIAKSNTTTLTYREPVYSTLRELVMSYFEYYFNINSEKTLRSYSDPVDLSQFGVDWIVSSDDLEYMNDPLIAAKHYDLLTPAMIKRLSPVDKKVFALTLAGANMDGIYKPE